MSIVSLIAAEQARYVAFFERAVVDARRARTQAVRELLISINNEALPYPYRYLRIDLIAKQSHGSDEVLQFLDGPDPGVEGRGFNLGGAIVEFHPFAWCEAQIAFDAPPADLQAIETFLTAWLDLEDRNRTGDAGPANAIHSATPIETNGQLWFLTIDFGTAPPDALIDFIDLLLNQGMNRIIVLTPPAQ